MNSSFPNNPNPNSKLHSDTQKLKTLEKANTEDISEFEFMPDTAANRIDPEDTNFQTQSVETMEMVHHPANSKSAWTSEELEILQRIKDNFHTTSERDRYSKYQIVCRERNIPDRTFSAFRKKVHLL